MEWKTLIWDCLQVVWLDHFTWLVLNSDFCAVKVSQAEVNSREGFDQSDFVFDQEISTLSLELLVGLLLDHNDNVARLLAREFVSLTVESVLAIVWCTFVNNCVENFLFFRHLFALASLALVCVINDLAFSAAIIARSLGLRVHAWSKLGHASHNTSSTACGTLLDSALFASLAFAGSANALSVDCNFGALSTVDFLKGALEWVHHWLTLLGASWPTTTAHAASEKTAEKVIHTVGGTTTFFDSLLTILVVQLSLLTITEHFVSSLDFLEPFFITTTVRMVSSSELKVSFLNRVEICVLFNPKGLVELGVVDLFGRATSAWHATHLLEVPEWETTSSEEHFVCSV